MPKVLCTSNWWFNRTLIKKGTTLDVPAGTPVPQGFFVDGVEVPRRSRKNVVDSTKDATIEMQAKQIAELTAHVAVLLENQRPASALARKSKGETFM